MQLPPAESCSHDPFLARCRQSDEKQFLSNTRGANQRFEIRTRILNAVDMMMRHLGPNTDSQRTRIADFACGTASFGIQLAEQGHAVDLIDNQAKFLEYAKLKADPILAKNIRYQLVDVTVEPESESQELYSGIFLGEAIEHFATPLEALKKIAQQLKIGGVLVLTTPNGDYIDCYEPSWEEVKDKTERNQALANTLGNHVCEFRKSELKQIVKEAGFCILEHKVIISKTISRNFLIRFLLPEKWLMHLDQKLSRKQKNGKDLGKIQILAAQRV
jgi:2-polyprenyl-3-methyl-5-hydroxy-6-metoxy-1,4-benzoquinol methylase